MGDVACRVEFVALGCEQPQDIPVSEQSVLARVGRQGVADVRPVWVVLDQNLGAGQPRDVHLSRRPHRQMGGEPAPTLAGDPADVRPAEGLDRGADRTLLFGHMAGRQPVWPSRIRQQ